jgi:hypothetical protein
MSWAAEWAVRPQTDDEASGNVSGRLFLYFRALFLGLKNA